MEKLRRILVVDGSRVVRATLAKHLKNDFEIREEANGESAWQTLVLDSTIAAVISSVHAPKLEARDLLERLRASSLRRLNGLPFLLIASDREQAAGQDTGTTPGIAGFITKTMQKAEIIARLRAALEPRAALKCQGLPEVRGEELAALVVPAVHTPTLMSRDEIERRIAQALSAAAPQTCGVSALMFGIVNYDALIDRFGEEVADDIGSRFAHLLLNKIGPHDCIARYSGERLVIVSRGVELDQCAHFAKRVCQSLESGHITIRGQLVKLNATAGAATSSEQSITSGTELLALASQRLDRALGCGGNAVVIDNRPECPLHNAGLLLPKMLAALNAVDEKTIAARIGSLGLQILPLIKVMDQEFSLGLHLPDIRRLLVQRANLENGAGNADPAG